MYPWRCNMNALSSSPFDRLPEELYLDIYAYLRPCELGTIARVSLLWNRLANDDCLWRKFCMQSWPYVPKSEGLNWKEYFQKYHKTNIIRDFFSIRKTLYSVSEKTITIWKESTEPNRYDCQSFLTNHHHLITRLFVTFEGNRTPSTILLTGSVDTTIKIWVPDQDGTLFNCLETLEGHEDAITALKQTGNFLFSGSKDKTIKIWQSVFEKDHTSSYCTHTLKGHEGTVTCLQIVRASEHSSKANDNSCEIFSGSTDQTIRGWEALPKGKYKCTKIIHDHRGAITCLALSLHERLLISTATDKTIRVRTLDPRNYLQTQQVIDITYIATCILMPAFKRLLIVGGTNGEVHHFEKKRDSIKWTLKSKAETGESLVTTLRFGIALNAIDPNSFYIVSEQNKVIMMKKNVQNQEVEYTSSLIVKNGT